MAPALVELLYFWCGQEDLNLHSVSRTSTSSWRVCQFRHGRNGYKTGYIGIPLCLQLNDFKEHGLSHSLAPQASASANSATSAIETYFLVPVLGEAGLFFWTTGGGAPWRFSSTLPVDGDVLVALMTKASEVIINRVAAMVVAFDKRVVVPRGPKTV